MRSVKGPSPLAWTRTPTAMTGPEVKVMVNRPGLGSVLGCRSSEEGLGNGWLPVATLTTTDPVALVATLAARGSWESSSRGTAPTQSTASSDGKVASTKYVLIAPAA